MHALRVACPQAGKAAALACVLPAGLARGCGLCRLGAGRAPAGLIRARPWPQVSGPSAAQIVGFHWSELPPSPLGLDAGRRRWASTFA
jgi:hypothetical protein